MYAFNHHYDHAQADRVLKLIERQGYSVHVRHMSPVLDGSEPIPIELYAVRSVPNPVCQIVEIAPDREQAEYVAAVQLAESLGIRIITLEAPDEPGKSAV
jgi:hypothetical protein